MQDFGRLGGSWTGVGAVKGHRTRHFGLADVSAVAALCIEFGGVWGHALLRFHRKKKVCCLRAALLSIVECSGSLYYSFRSRQNSCPVCLNHQITLRSLGLFFFVVVDHPRRRFHHKKKPQKKS